MVSITEDTYGIGAALCLDLWYNYLSFARFPSVALVVGRRNSCETGTLDTIEGNGNHDADLCPRAFWCFQC